MLTLSSKNEKKCARCTSQSCSRCWLVVAYYTDRYEQEATELRKSLEEQALPFCLHRIEDKGSWLNNVRHKPTFILEALQAFNRPVVYVDADAVFEGYPKLFDGYGGYDFAYWVYGGESRFVASGTLYVAQEAEELIRIWKTLCDNEKGDTNDQDLLARALFAVQGINTMTLPLEYCQIFDWEQQTKNPIIVHHQASRRLRF